MNQPGTDGECNRPRFVSPSALYLAAVLVFAIVPACSLGADSDAADVPSLSSRRLSVAVLEFEDSTGDTETAHWRHTLPGLLKRQIRNVHAVRLLSDDAVHYAFRQVGLRSGDAIDPNRARQMGEHIEAQRVVWGSYRKQGDLVRVDVHVMNVAGGTVSNEISVTAADWFDIRDAVNARILADLGVTPSEEEERKMAKRWTRSAEALSRCGKAYLMQEQGRPESEIEACCREAILADPNCAFALVALGGTLANRGQFGPAEDAIRRAIQLDPSDAQAHFALGFVLASQRQPEQGNGEFLLASRLDPDDAHYVGALATVQAIKGNWEQATSLFERAVTLDPTSAELHASLARACAARGLRDKALGELKQATHYLLSDSPAAGNALQRIAETYEMLEQRSEAIDHYERLIALAEKLQMNPNSIRAFARRVERLKAALSPKFVEAPVPQRYMRDALDKALHERLTDDERRYVVYPFACTAEMNAWAERLTSGAATDVDKAKAIFDELTRRAGANGLPSARTAEEVYRLWGHTETPLMCGDQTVLFIALARAAGVDAFFTYVGKDPEGGVTHHACAAVHADGRMWLVDPTWHWFGIPHQEFSVLDDLRTIATFCFIADTEKAPHCRAGLKLYPESVFGRLSLVNALRESKQMQEASDLLEAMAEPQGPSWNCHFFHLLRGVIAGNRGDFEQAGRDLAEALAAYSESDAAHFHLGLLLERRGQLRQAREAYRAALTCLISPETADMVRRRLAELNERIGFEPLDEVHVLIQQAGNADSDEERLATLRQMQARTGLDASLRADLDRLIPEIERWSNDKALDYFGGQVGRTRDYDFGISENSPLYPLTCLYRGRMVTWYALESGTVWKTPKLKRAFLDTARGFFEQAAAAFPENRITRMYLGAPIPPDRLYPSGDDAPVWAVCQRESLERLADIIEWWIDNRMRPDGQYGGGWGDDCEMWRWWTPILIGFEDPKIDRAQARFSQAILAQSHMKPGYTTRMSDVEHTAEDSADAITPMMHLDPDNPDWSKRALRLAELMETLWTGHNERGLLQFKSTYFTAEKLDLTPARACDTVYHARVVQPALLYWQRTGDPALKKLFCAWMDTWVDAAARAERGKPAGIIPTAIHWPDGDIGGLDPNWWDPRNHSEHTLYLFPSAMSMMMHTLLLTYHMTGDEKYLQPIRSMAKIRLAYLESPPKEAPAPGSEAWCAARLDSLTDVAAKYKFLTGRSDFDALLAREKSPYVRYRLDNDREPLVRAMKENADALRTNFPGYTSEVRYTDRVLRFPTLFGPNGITKEAIPAIRTPSPALLYSSVTGDPGSAEYFPLNVVRWLTPARDIAAMVCEHSKTELQAELFHFGRDDRAMGAEFYLLEPGAYTLALLVGNHGPAEPTHEQAFDVTGPRTRVSFTLPPHRQCFLRVRHR
jgi:tetratricopeptide (TPR) repeat protein